MSRKPYAEVLKDPRWQRKRLEILEYADFRCQLCGDKRNTLHVHHSYYTKGKKPWEYPNGSMVALCEKHHEWYSNIQRKERYDRLYENQNRHREPEPPAVEPAKEEPVYLTNEEAGDFIARIRRTLLEGAQ